MQVRVGVWFGPSQPVNELRKEPRMQPDFNALFAEIFDATSPQESLGNPQDVKPVPRLPIEDPVYGYHAYGAASADISRIERDVLIEQLAPGTETDPATGLRKQPAQPAPVADFGTFLKNTIRYTERARDLDAGQHSRVCDCRQIVENAFAKLLPRQITPDISEALDRCANSAAMLVRESLTEVL
jgi:hypothetical protein